jgi:hypothetical protein
MATYLYCVLPADAPDPTGRGIDGAALRALRDAGVCVWVADVSTAPRPDLDHIREHDSVIRAAMDTGFTPVPIRFGQVAGSDDDVRSHLASRDYRPDLERIAGCVEFGIRVLDPDARDPEPDAIDEERAGTGPGAAHMKMLAARMQALQRTRARSLDVARELDGQLTRWARDTRIAPSDRPAGATVAHLVQAAAADTYVARARELSHGHPPLRIVVTGPWPPYSFVE